MRPGGAVGAPLDTQPRGLAARRAAATEAPVRQRRRTAFDRRGGRLRHRYAERRTRAIGHAHGLWSLAAVRLPDPGPPCVAVRTMPSLPPASQRTFWRASWWARTARHLCQSPADAAQAGSRRWTVLLAP
jgi:hypothetical protein